MSFYFIYFFPRNVIKNLDGKLDMALNGCPCKKHTLTYRSLTPAGTTAVSDSLCTGVYSLLCSTQNSL